MHKRKKYTPTQLSSAIAAVKKQHLSPSQAAEEYSVPRQTVVDHVSGHINRSTCGPNRMLTVPEEEALAEYLKYMALRGFPLNRQHLKAYVMEIIRRKNMDDTCLFNMEKGPSDKWCRSFIARHKDLREKTPQTRDRGRTRMSNQTVMDNFFKTYEETVDRLNLRDRPEQIFNCDETGFVQKQGSEGRKAIGIRGVQCIQQQLHTFDHVTAQMCVSGDGKVLPTFIIYQKALPHRPYREDVPRTWLFGVSESGYMDADLFKSWFRNIFIPNCGRERPVLLLLDNHDSHISIEVIEMARANRIEMLAFPAHTTHLLQPLDVSIFGPLKDKMKSLATSLSLANTNMMVSKASLPPLLSYGIDQTCSPVLVKAAFRKSGLIPCNPSVIDKTMLLPEDFQRKEKEPASETLDPERQSDEHNEEENAVSQASIQDVPTDPHEKQPSTCSQCGSSTRPHPIEAVRNLPPILQSIFLTPSLPKADQKKKRRVVLDARVITGDNMLNQLKKKEKEEKEKREGIERRKREREEKRNKKSSKSVCGKKKKVRHEGSDDEEEENVVCGVCALRDPDDEEVSTSWIMCDVCDVWYHTVCVECNEEEENFICNAC